MKFACVILASILCTAVLLGCVLFRENLTQAFVLVLLICALIQRYLRGTWWHRVFFVAWLGTSFLLTNWLILSEGGQSVSAFVTFGPGFLIIAAYELIKHRSVIKHRSGAETG